LKKTNINKSHSRTNAEDKSRLYIAQQPSLRDKSESNYSL